MYYYLQYFNISLLQKSAQYLTHGIAQSCFKFLKWLIINNKKT